MNRLDKEIGEAIDPNIVTRPFDKIAKRTGH